MANTISKQARDAAKAQGIAVAAITLDRRTAEPPGGSLGISGKISDPLAARLNELMLDWIRETKAEDQEAFA